jgi:hypothetical protein
MTDHRYSLPLVRDILIELLVRLLCLMWLGRHFGRGNRQRQQANAETGAQASQAFPSPVSRDLRHVEDPTASLRLHIEVKPFTRVRLAADGVVDRCLI